MQLQTPTAAVQWNTKSVGRITYSVYESHTYYSHSATVFEWRGVWKVHP